MAVNTEEEDRAWLELVKDAQKALTDALNSLGGTEVEYLDRFRLFTAVHVNRAADGYILLRQAGKFEASKHLIRTMVESYIRQAALEAHPELLFQVTYGEFRDNKAWVRSIRDYDVTPLLTQMDQDWNAFKLAYSAKYPGHPLPEQKLKLERAAQLAGIEYYYGMAYRLYCQFTHASYRASSGELADLEDADSRNVAFCVLYFVGVLAGNGAAAPNFSELWRQLQELDGKQTS